MKAKTILALVSAVILTLLAACDGLFVRATKIVFVSDRGGNNEVYVMDFTGGDLSQIAATGDDNIEAMVSPNGEQIVFVSDRDGNYEIYVMSLDGSNVVRLTNNAFSDRQPCWSPNSTKIVWAQFDGTDWQLWQMNSDGTGVIQLTNTGGENSMPSWGHGNLIYFASNRGGNLEIWRIDAGALESNPTRMTSTGGWNGFPAASPNNQLIAWVSDQSDPGVAFEIWYMNIDGTDPEQLTDTGALNQSLKWTSNSKALVFSRDTGGGNFDIWRTEVVGATGETNLSAHASANTSPSAARP